MVRVKVHRIHDEPVDQAVPKVPVATQRKKTREPDAAPFRHFNKRRRSIRRRTIFGIISGIVLCIAIIFVVFTYIYDRAVVIVSPKTADIMVNGAYNAYKDTTAFPYEIIQTNETASTTIPASPGPSVEK